MTPRLEKARVWLGTAKAPRWIIALAALLTASSLASGLAVDDYLHALELMSIPWPRTSHGPLDLFRFAGGDVPTARALMDIGQFPWTTDTATRFAFFRPLSAATHWLDYALWPHAPWLMHAQNLAWFSLALAGVGAMYRRFLGPTWVAGLALLLYAVDDTNGPTVGWIANRNALVALAFAVPVVILHDRWRRGGDARAAWMAPPLLGVALLAGESALGIVAYLAAYQLHLDVGTWRARAARLAPYLGVLAVWRALYGAMGYGVAGSGTYLDPAKSPLQFLAALPFRLPFLLQGQFLAPRSDASVTYEYLPGPMVPIMAAFAVVVLGVLVAAFLPLWRRDPVARFFTTGLLLAALPVCAAFAGDRLLLFVGLGAMGLVAQLIASADAALREGSPPQAPLPRLRRLTLRALIFIHLVLAPLLLVYRSSSVVYEMPNGVACRTIPRTPDIAQKTVVLVNPPNDIFYVYVPATRAVLGEPGPARLRGLANVIRAGDASRVDAFTLRLAPDGGFLQSEPERMMRGARNPLKVGDVVDVAGMRVTITRLTPQGYPAEALFRFDVPLEDPSLVWMQWTRDGYAPWTPPPVGTTVRLPPHDFPQFMRDRIDLLTGR